MRDALRVPALCLAVTVVLFAITTAGRLTSMGDIAVHEDQYREFILPAMAMFSGDFNPHAFVYGAPSMYFIHGVWQLHYAALKVIGAPGIDTPLDYAAAFFVDPSRSYAAARAGFCALWFLLIWIACLTGSRIGGVPVGCLVGAIVALTPVARERLMAMQPDTTIYLCAIVTLYVAVRMERKPSHDLLLGTIIGLGVAVKALGLMFAAAYLVWRIWDVRRSGLAPVAKSALTGMAGMCAGFILSSPFTVLAWDEFRTGMEFQLAYNQVSGYANRLETSLHVIGNLAWPTRGVGPIGLLAALAAFPTALRSPSEGLRFVAVTGIVGLSFLSVQPAFHRNWLMPAVPAVAVLAGMGALLCSRRASQRWRLANHVAFAICSVLIVGPMLAYAVRSTTNQPKRDVPRDTGQYAWYPAQMWIERHVPAGSGLLIVVNPQYAPRLLPTADSPPQPRDAYLGPGSLSTRFLIEARQRAARLQPAVVPSYRLYHRLHLWGPGKAERYLATPTAAEAQAQWHELAWYVRRGVEYILVDECVASTYDHQDWPPDRRFFRDLRRTATLVKRFKTTQPENQPAFRSGRSTDQRARVDVARGTSGDNGCARASGYDSSQGDVASVL